MDDKNKTRWFSRLWASLSDADAIWHRRWMTLTIGKKLLLGFGAVTLILIITVVTSLIAIRDIRVFSDRMINHRMPAVSNSTAISRDIYASSAVLNGWILTGEESYKLEHKAIWQQINRLVQSTDRLSTHWKNAQQLATWEKAKVHILQLRRVQDKVESFSRKDNFSVTAAFLTKDSIAYTKEMNADLMRMHASQKKISNLVIKLQREISAATLSLQKYFVSGDAVQKKAFTRNWAASSAAFSTIWAVKDSLSTAQKKLLEKLSVLRGHFALIANKLITLRQTNAWSRSNYLLLAQAEPEASRILDLLIGSKNVSGERLGGLQGAQYFSLIANTYGLLTDITRFQWFEWIMLFLGTLISLIIAVITARVICRPLKQAFSIAASIAGGKRNVEIKSHTTDDEAGRLINALAYMQTSIRKVESKLEVRREEMRHMAFHDTLTGLPNRHQFQNDIERLLKLAERHKRSFGLIFLDLDHFKTINDTLGHDVGDLLLIAVAKRLNETLRKTDFLARLSGDEFAVVLYDIKSDHVSGRVARKVIEAISKPFQIKTYEVNITVSIGAACYPSAGTSIEEIMKNADIAMYRAKQKGRNNFQYFNAAVSERHDKRLFVENNLNYAIDRQQFSLVYQPIFGLLAKKAVGVEALLRWNHPKFGFISPEYFIPIADEMGMMRTIDQWVFRRACEQYRTWLSTGVDPFTLSINLTSAHASYAVLFLEILNELNLPKDKIYLELTETSIMENVSDFEGILTRLNASGLKMAIDDFGKGYSSLSRLHRLPVHVLKIDRSFVKGIGVESGSEIIIKSIVALGKSLDLKVIAEGIETKAQLDFLIKLGCEFIQGFYYAKPLAPDDAIAKFK